MEPPHPGVDRTDRDTDTRLYILSEPGMERGGEVEAVAHRPASSSHAKRSLGGDVHGIGVERLNHAHESPARQQGQRNVAIGWAGDRDEAVGADDFDDVAHGAQFVYHGGHRADHAIDLRCPCVCDNQNPMRRCVRHIRAAISPFLRGGCVRQLRGPRRAVA